MVIVPNCGVFTKRFGVPRFTLFSALNASARNWKLVRSLMRKARARAKSMVCSGGPDTEFRPALPYVKAGGAAKAAGVEQFPGGGGARPQKQPAGNGGGEGSFPNNGPGGCAVPAAGDGRG